MAGRDHEKYLYEILNLLTQGKTYEEISTELNISRSLMGRILKKAKWEHGFKTVYQMLADYVKSKWWPGESERSGLWKALDSNIKFKELKPLEKGNYILDTKGYDSLGR